MRILTCSKVSEVLRDFHDPEISGIILARGITKGYQFVQELPKKTLIDLPFWFAGAPTPQNLLERHLRDWSLFKKIKKNKNYKHFVEDLITLKKTIKLLSNDAPRLSLRVGKQFRPTFWHVDAVNIRGFLNYSPIGTEYIEPNFAKEIDFDDCRVKLKEKFTIQTALPNSILFIKGIHYKLGKNTTLETAKRISPLVHREPPGRHPNRIVVVCET